MTGWVILVDQPKDLPNAETPHKVITTSEYLARPRLFDLARPKLVNLARSYAYQSKGYYASLLAEARGHRVVPTVETMLELREQKLYEHALPELEDELNRCARRADFQPESELRLLICFGIARDQRFESFGRLLFDWFRCPALEVIVEPGQWLSIDRIRPRAITRLSSSEADFLREALHQHTRREWRDPKARIQAKYDLAVLYDPNEKMPPSSPASIKYFVRIAEKLSVDIEPITRRQLA
jgi:glutathione synthase/RimK-type ligase-like ATP-grasp enzyme